MKVEICGVNTSKLPVLSEEKKSELLEKIKAGDTSARELFIKGNLRLVLSVVHKFNNTNENLDDLFQIGCIGLIKAVDNFDTSLNVKFSTYAVPMIQGELRRHLRDNNYIRISRSLRDIAYKAIMARDCNKEGKNFDIKEFAKELGVSEKTIYNALDAVRLPVSLYEPLSSNDNEALYVMDQVSDKSDSEDKWIENITLNEAVNSLPKKEKNIIDLRFFAGKTQMEVAEELSISQAQVSRIEKNALNIMRNYLM